MPIVLVHGVRERNRHFWPGMDNFLRSYVTRAVAPEDPDNVPILRAYWGDAGARFRWGGVSRPRSVIFQQGAHEEQAARTIAAASLHPELEGLPQQPVATVGTGVLVPMGPGGTAGLTEAPRLRLSTLEPRQLSDLVATVIARSDAEPERQALFVIAADEVAHDPGTRQDLARTGTSDEEIDLLIERIEARYASTPAERSLLVQQGADDWFRKHVGDPLREAVERGVNLPGWIINRALTELRGPINDQMTGFFGDVFVYLEERGTKKVPGPIPRVVLDKLAEAKAEQDRRGGEPIVVITHSMGGQIVYDAVTTWLPRLPKYAGIRIDFWCAAASQVGLFEELKLFLASDDKYGHDPEHPDPSRVGLVPRPSRSTLGGWWNVWDHNDFLSYRVKSIIEGVDDGEWSSGKWFPFSHGGYFVYASFFRELVARLSAAKNEAWLRDRP